MRKGLWGRECEKAQKNSRDLNSEDVEEQKQTLLSTEDVEMWVTHLDSVKKRRQAGARKAATTRKQKSSDKVATAGNEFWCLCGGQESSNMIACDNPGCPTEWFHFACVGLVDAPSGKCFALNVLFNICSKLSLFRYALLRCEIHILVKFNNPQQGLFRCIKRKLLPY